MYYDTIKLDNTRYYGKGSKMYWGITMIIYKAENIITNEIYIGMTKKDCAKEKETMFTKRSSVT